MIKRIKEYFRKKKERKLLDLQIQHEVLETLCTICLYLEFDGHFGHNRYAQHMGTHFRALKEYSDSIREEVSEKGSRIYKS